MSKVLITSNRLSKRRGVITTTARNVNDVAKLNKWRTRLFWSHIQVAVNEVMDYAKT